MNKILSHLGYDLDPEWVDQFKKDLHHYYFQKLMNSWKDNCYKLRFVIFAIMIVIIVLCFL